MLNKDEILKNPTMYDCDDILKHYQFTENELEKIVDYVNMITILQTQKLSLDFIVKYILNNEYQNSDRDTLLTPKIVAQWQRFSVDQIVNHKV